MIERGKTQEAETNISRLGVAMSEIKNAENTVTEQTKKQTGMNKTKAERGIITSTRM